MHQCSHLCSRRQNEISERTPNGQGQDLLNQRNAGYFNLWHRGSEGRRTLEFMVSVQGKLPYHIHEVLYHLPPRIVLEGAVCVCVCVCVCACVCECVSVSVKICEFHTMNVIVILWNVYVIPVVE